MPQTWEYPVTRKVLAARRFPAGAFDPVGDWQQAYDIYFMNVRTKRGRAGKRPLRPAAALAVGATPRDNHVALRFDYTAQMDGDRALTTALCRADALLSPESWTQTYTNAMPAGKGLVDLTKKGQVRDGRLLLDGREPSVSRALSAYTADWCLLPAVQRLAAAGNTVRHSFDLIEEFAMLRGDQTLLHRGTTQVATQGGDVTVQVFCHFGESVIPTLYYVDDTTHRLILVVSTRRTIVLREEA